MMNLLSPQRLQMDVMLADEAKVKVDVALQGEVESGVVQPVPILNKHVDGQNPQIAPLSTVAGQPDDSLPVVLIVPGARDREP